MPDDKSLISGGEQKTIDDPRIVDFVESFRDSKHHLLNSISIWIAQAELAQRDPVYYSQLAKSILERADLIVQKAHATEAKLKRFAAYREKL